MAITKVSRNLLNTGVSDSSDATAITITSDEKVGLGVTTPADYLFSNPLAISAPSGANSGLTIVSATDSNGTLAMADGTSGVEQYRGFVQYSHLNEAMFIGANGATVVRLDSDGLKFGSDSAAANALDDYEEGSHAATVSMTSGSMTFNMTYNTMSYTKIGNRVFISGYFVCASTANNTSGVANMKWSLPFPCHNATTSESTISLAFNSANISNASNMWAYIPRNHQRVEFYYTSTSTGSLVVSDTAVQGDWDVRFHGSYVTNV